MVNGLPGMLSKLQESIDELNARIITLANDTQSNFETLESRLNARMDVMREELRKEMEKGLLQKN